MIITGGVSAGNGKHKGDMTFEQFGLFALESLA